MSLTLALNSTPGTTFSSGGALTTPLSFTFDGIPGGEKEVHLLLTNTSSSTVTVTKIEATTLASYPSDISSVGFKLGLGDSYTSTSLSTSISLASSASQSFYVKVVVPAGRSVFNIKDIGLKVTY
tara:strand:- start:119 stop:493 length:375 start_codon:yes stop_codon:yes gene_type:complete